MKSTYVLVMLLPATLLINVVSVQAVPPIEPVWIEKLSFTGPNGVEAFNAVKGDLIIIESPFRSTLYYNQSFVHVMQITDANGYTVSLSWVDGILSPKQEMVVRQSWIPEKPGEYKIKVVVWDSLELPGFLSLARTAEIKVYPDTESLPFDFRLQVGPPKLKMQRGTTVEIMVNVEPIVGENQNVRLYVDNVPNGFNVTLDQPFIGHRPPYTQPVIIETSPSLTSKIYSFDIRGESGSIYHVIPVEVMVVKEDLTNK